MSIDVFLLVWYTWVRRVVGLITKPYETYRTIEEKGTWREYIPLTILIGIYLGISSLVKTAAFRPFVLTRHMVKTSGAVLVTFFFVSMLLWSVSRLFGGKGTYQKFSLAWAYTLVPTVCWFFFTSLLYVFFPPPRTTQWSGVSLSVVFLTLSSVLLFWKIILGYLSLRFGMKMDLVKICLTILIVAPLVGLYSLGMYRMGIFRVPFL